MSMRSLLDQFATIKSAKFASFQYRTKGTNELARYLVILGVNLTNVYKKDIETLEGLIPSLTGVDLVAAEEILASLHVSLDSGIGNNPDYVHGKSNADTYTRLEEVPNVKLNKNDGALHLVDVLLHDKTVIEAGTYKAVKSSDKTLAKKAIDKHLRRGKIRQFALTGIQIAKLNGEVLELA